MTGKWRGCRRVLSAFATAMVVLALAGSALAVAAKPSIKGFTPARGGVDTKLTITGANFTGATTVKIGGASAPFKVISATKISAIVPARAKKGKVTVTTKGGTATSARSFTFSGGSVTAPTVTAPAAASYPPNGLGTLTVSPANVVAGSAGNQMTFTFTAGAGGLSNGTIAITVPAGWTAPVTTAAPGCVSASNGGTGSAIAVSQQTILFFHVTLAAGATATVTYGALAGGSFTGATCLPADGAVAPTTPGPSTFLAQEKSNADLTTAGGALTSLAASPTVTVT